MRNKNFIATSLILGCALSACQAPQIPMEIKKPDYDMIKQFMIPYEDIFNFKESYYFVYIYSLHCLHCELIKKDVIDYAYYGKVKMRFIEYYQDIPILDDVSETIGQKDVSGLGILGTPALLMVESLSISINVSGMDMVKNVLDAYN